MAIEAEHMIAADGTVVGVTVRSSRNPGLVMVLTPVEWESFLADIKAGVFDKLDRDEGRSPA